MTHLEELLSVYLDGETSPAESLRVVAHLKDCLRCRRRLDEINQARTAVRSLPMVDLPAGLLVTAPDDAHRGGRRVWVGAVAAAVAAVIAVATLTPGPEPLDLDDVSRQVGARAALEVGAGPLKVVVPAVNE